MPSPAQNAAVIYDATTRQILMAIVPEYEEELNDPAFQPKSGQARILVPIDIFRQAGGGVSGLSALMSYMSQAVP